MKRAIPVILLLAAMTLFLFYRKNNENDTEGITRAQTARLLAWTACDHKNSSKSVEPLMDVDSRLWYADDIEKVRKAQLMQTDGDCFHPTRYLTWQEAAAIADTLGTPLSVPVFQKQKSIPLNDWLDFFDQWLQTQHLQLCQPVRILALPSTDSTLSNWQVQTDQGIYSCEGLVLEPYLGQTVTAYISGDQLLMIRPGSNTPTEILTASTAAETEITDSTEATDNQASTLPDIRVCLLDDASHSEWHSRISLTSDTTWHLTFKDETREYQAGDTATLTVDDLKEEGDSVEVSAQDQTPITVLSLERHAGHPSYKGRLRIIRYNDHLCLINILPVETYLKGVLPSEMPASYHLEALKAQAVCARSYAMAALTHPKYDFADVNDSTDSQVYMQQLTDTRCDQAVDATAGEVLVYEHKIAEAKYFSTSCGSLSDSDAIWTYPDSGSGTGYMTARLATEPPGTPDLDQESHFQTFIQHPEDNRYIEQSDPWFRWHVFLPITTIQNNLRRLFASQMAADPKRFSVLSPDGTVDAEDVLRIEVVTRAKSGVLQKIRFIGTEQELTVCGEYHIRSLLAPSDASVILQDGSTREGMQLLPSGYCYWDPVMENEKITGYTVYGGGFGHGAGLSQNGAHLLAEKGYDYQKILHYFFEGIDIESVNTLQ